MNTSTEASLILHIDDDEANRYAVKIILEKNGYRVASAPDGTEGLKMLQLNPDLVILDIRLPDMDGFEVCRRIKASPQYNSIPVLQTSATFVSNDYKVEGLESGADGYLAQPIESSVLVATVRSLMRIRRAERSALEATIAREEMMAIVSHDLRNPLTAIMIQSQTLKRMLTQGTLTQDDIDHRMDRITHACKRMNRLIGDILDTAGLENGQIKLIRTNFFIEGLIIDTFKEFEEIASENDISLDYIVPNNFNLNADRERLAQVFHNLISNSIKYTPAGGKIIISATLENNRPSLKIADTGKGIPAEYLPHIFDRYWQGKEKKGGIGLGLSIVKGIIDSHGGELSVESTLNQGTTVHFKI